MISDDMPPVIHHYEANLCHDEFALKLDEMAADGWELVQFAQCSEYRVSAVWRKEAR